MHVTVINRLRIFMRIYLFREYDRKSAIQIAITVQNNFSSNAFKIVTYKIYYLLMCILYPLAHLNFFYMQQRLLIISKNESNNKTKLMSLLLIFSRGKSLKYSSR